MSEWREEDGELVRDLKFDDFAAAMTFVNRVAELAEEANHHPDILVHGWNKVREPVDALRGADHRQRPPHGGQDRRGRLSTSYAWRAQSMTDDLPRSRGGHSRRCAA
jgi:Pterin 4 alpha carbinolamine dehydratase